MAQEWKRNKVTTYMPLHSTNTTSIQPDQVLDSYRELHPHGLNDAVGQMIQSRNYGPNTLTALSIESYAYEAAAQVSPVLMAWVACVTRRTQYRQLAGPNKR